MLDISRGIQQMEPYGYGEYVDMVRMVKTCWNLQVLVDAPSHDS